MVRATSVAIWASVLSAGGAETPAKKNTARTHLQLVEHPVRHPPDLGIERQDVDGLARRRVRQVVRPRTQLLPVLQPLLGLEHERDQVRRRAGTLGRVRCRRRCHQTHQAPDFLDGV